MNKIIEQSISYPQVVKVFAEKYIMALYSSGWYEKNKIHDPAYSYYFIHERVYGKYLENCYKMPKELKNLFTENEQKGIQDRIIENNIILSLTNQGFLKAKTNSQEIELTIVGRLCIQKLIDPEILTKENGYKPNKKLKNNSSNIILWMVDKGFLVSYIDRNKKEIKRIEDMIFCFTPKGIRHLDYIINPKIKYH